jgi:AcrR family transcriptional regulator
MARPRSDLRARLLAAARTRFLAHGVDGTSLRTVAADARTSIGLLRYYFTSKDDLFLAVVEQTYVRLLDQLEAALAPSRPVVDRVRALYRRVGELDDEELATVRLVVREALTSTARLEHLIARFQRGHLPLVFALVRDGIAGGVFRDDVAPALVAAAMLMLGGPAQRLLLAAANRAPFGTFPAGGALSDALVALLLDGVARRQRPRRITVPVDRPPPGAMGAGRPGTTRHVPTGAGRTTVPTARGGGGAAGTPGAGGAAGAGAGRAQPPRPIGGTRATGGATRPSRKKRPPP